MQILNIFYSVHKVKARKRNNDQENTLKSKTPKNMSEKKLNLAEMVPNAIGMIAFDEDGQIIESVGIGNERKGDISQLQQVKLDDEGFGMLEHSDVQVLIYKQDGKTIAIYTHQGK